MITQFYHKHREIVLYLGVGAIVTTINFLSYYIFNRIMYIPHLVSNGLSWFLSLMVAYIADKILVFRNVGHSIKGLILQFSAFVSLRLFSGAMDMFLFFLLFTVSGVNDFLTKLIVGVVVTVTNYLFSKYFIFRNNKNVNLSKGETGDSINSIKTNDK